jgi:hypothetical protein
VQECLHGRTPFNLTRTGWKSIVPLRPDKEERELARALARAPFAIKPLDQAAQLPALGIGETSIFDQVREERRQRPAAKRIGDGAEPPADQLFTVNRRPEYVHSSSPIALHKPLRFETIEQFLNGGVHRRPFLLVHPVDQLPDRGRPRVPEGLQERQLGFGHVMLLPVHAQPHLQDNMSERYSKTKRLRGQGYLD